MWVNKKQLKKHIKKIIDIGLGIVRKLKKIIRTKKPTKGIGKVSICKKRYEKKAQKN